MADPVDPNAPPDPVQVAPRDCGWTVEVSGPDGSTVDVDLGDMFEFMEEQMDGGNGPPPETWIEKSRTTETLELASGVTADRITKVVMERPNGQLITLQFATQTPGG